MNSVAAISVLDRPRATAASTSVSRGVSCARARAGLVDGGAGWRRNSSTSRRVTLGASSASPPATTRTAASNSAGSVSFNRKPLAPARNASNTYSSRSNVVRITTRVEDSRSSPVIRRVASTPSIPGIRMSIRTTSGRSLETSSTAACPSAASPTTSMSSADRSRTANPPRTRAWSSAIATRITSSECAPRSGGNSSLEAVAEQLKQLERLGEVADPESSQPAQRRVGRQLR